MYVDFVSIFVRFLFCFPCFLLMKVTRLNLKIKCIYLINLFINKSVCKGLQHKLILRFNS